MKRTKIHKVKKQIIYPKIDLKDMIFIGGALKCPYCKEAVPVTLYCLNCGGPLFTRDEIAIVEKKLFENGIPKNKGEVKLKF